MPEHSFDFYTIRSLAEEIDVNERRVRHVIDSKLRLCPCRIVGNGIKLYSTSIKPLVEEALKRMAAREAALRAFAPVTST